MNPFQITSDRQLEQIREEQDRAMRMRETTFYEIRPPARPAHVFGGFKPYVRAAAGRLGMDLADPNTLRNLSKSESSWHASQIGDALGQLPGLAFRGADSAAASVANLAALRDSLAALLEAADAAICETCAALGLIIPAQCIADADERVVGYSELVEADAAEAHPILNAPAVVSADANIEAPAFGLSLESGDHAVEIVEPAPAPAPRRKS